jgi:hypothetical protein
MFESSKDANDHRLFCLRVAAEYRNLAVDALPPALKAYLLRMAKLWDYATEPESEFGQLVEQTRTTARDWDSTPKQLRNKKSGQ